MPLTTTVAKFLDTSVCGGSWCLDPSLSPFLVKFTQILELILLDNPHKAAVLSVGCASLSSTLFPYTQLSVNVLGYSTLWTASFFGNECLWLTFLVKGVTDSVSSRSRPDSVSSPEQNGLWSGLSGLPEQTLWAPGAERALERTLWAPGLERALDSAEFSSCCLVLPCCMKRDEVRTQVQENMFFL